MIFYFIRVDDCVVICLKGQTVVALIIHEMRTLLLMHFPGHRRVHRRCANSVSSTLQSAYVTINIYCLQLRNYIAYI